MFGLGRRKKEELELLASVVSGTLDRDGKLRGTFGGRAVGVWFERLDPTPISAPDSFNPVQVVVVRLHLAATGGHPWFVQSEARLSLGGGHVFEFVRQPWGEALLRLSPWADSVAVTDPAVEARLTQGGLFEAIARLSPPSRLWLPRAQFRPDPRPAMMERLRGVPIPPDALTPSEGFNPNIGILIDVEREDDTDPTPQRFTAMLEAALAIAELNERLNPAS